MTSDPRVELLRLAVGIDFHGQMAADVRAGLTATPKRLPPKYFYDAIGSELFVRITQLEEYYQTRTETAILEDHAAGIVARARPEELVELGSGASRKTRLLLQAMHDRRPGRRVRYVPFDVSEDAILGAADALLADYDWLDVTGIVGDFDHHLDEVPRRGRRLVAFLGSTIGNFEATAQVEFLREVADMLAPGDTFVVGLDLVKDPAVLVRAYDDDAGVTAAFNRNVLANLNATLGADFELARFEHVARWNAALERIEMWLRSTVDQVVHVKDLDLEVPFAAGEELHTENSCKFTRASAGLRFDAGGLQITGWHTDPAGRFAVATAVVREAGRG